MFRRVLDHGYYIICGTTCIVRLCQGTSTGQVSLVGTERMSLVALPMAQWHILGRCSPLHWALFFSFLSFFFFFLETNEKNSLQGGTLGPFASVEGQYLIAVQNFSTLRLGQSIRALPPATAKGTGNNSCGTVVFTNASANIARTLIKSGRALGMELSKAL
jgi:hypothetical protein